MHKGLMLVQRDEIDVAPESYTRPGSSTLEISVLGHFNDLWSYWNSAPDVTEQVSRVIMESDNGWLTILAV